MKYVQPIGGAANDPYVDADPGAGVEGSPVPAAAIEHPMRELVALIAAAELEPDEAVLTQVVTAVQTLIQKQAPAVVGSMRNGYMSVIVASATATFTADEISVETGLGLKAYRLPNFNKTINLATIGAGGMDVGAAPAAGFVAVYAIYNPSTQVSALLAVNATAAVAPNIYGGANMPPGYTASALVSVWATNGGGQFAVGAQADRDVSIVPVAALSNGTATVLTPFSLAAAVPKNAKKYKGTLVATCVTSPALTATLGVSASNVGAGVGLAQFVVAQNVSALQTIAPFSDMPIIVPQTGYYVTINANGNAVGVSGYSF